MDGINLADAKTHLSELVEQAASGEPVTITRRGRPVARITAIATPRSPVNLASLRALTETMPMQAEPAGPFMRQARDEDRY